MSLTNFPDGPNGGVDQFTEQVDQGVPIEEPQAIPSQSPFTIQLGEVPLSPKRDNNGILTESSIFIKNFREIEGTPGPNQFNVDYNLGTLTFNSQDKGKALVIQYKTEGTTMFADDFNRIQDAVVALEQYALAPWLKSPNGTKWYLKVDDSGILTISNQP